MRRALRARSVCSMDQSPSRLQPWRLLDHGVAMKLQDFRVGLRILAKDPVYSLVSVLGLASYSWHYNVHIPDADNVYIVKQRNNLELGAPWYDQAPLLLLTVANT